MRTSDRVLLMLLVLLLALVVPLGATAGAKGKPAAQYANVTMDPIEGADGLETSCDGVGSIKMLRTSGAWQYMAADWYGDSERPILQVEAAIPWSRAYPTDWSDEQRSGTSLSGCHGVFDPDGDGTTSIPSSPLLMIATDGTGTPVSVAWRFDRYAVPEKVGKRMEARQLEGFALDSGPDFACEGINPYVCAGTFTLQRIDTVNGYLYEQGSAFFRFTIQITE